MGKPVDTVRRWNIDRDGDDLLICFDDHGKGEKCEYVRYVPASALTETRAELSQRQDRIGELRIELTAAQQRISDLEAQCARVAELEADSSRLQWLEDEPVEVSVEDRAIADTGDYDSTIAVYERYASPSRRELIGHGSTWRQAIDSAMADELRKLDAAIDAAMAAKGDDWLTREARQIGLHSPACASVRFGQNECDCGAAMAAKEAG